ncbi:MAG TPA: Ig-like domain-containing protein, partial [Gemmataceae bacterium]|nr:Ig-like domain-containing protein [Gemmataceae bacterium]
IFGGDLPAPGPGPEPLPIPGEPPGSDSLDGGTGNDSVTGGAGTDTVQGGTGNDTLTGGAGNDVIFGGEDTDTLSEAVGGSFTLTDAELRTADVDQLAGIEAARLFGGPGSDVLDARGFSGPAELTGGDGDDTVLGGTGNDILAGGAGNDSLVGGAGNDEYVFTGDTVGADAAVETAAGGTDTINLFALAGPISFSLSVPGQQALPGGSLTLINPFAFENLTGTPFADYLVGNPGPNVLIGSGGQDTLEGGEGDDVIQAGVTQVVYLDFDSYTGPGKRPYGPAERDQVQARLEAAYSPFGFRFTQTRPVDGAFATVFFNKTPFRINGREQPGGLADELDWRNLGLGRTVAVDVNGFLGYATRQVSPTTSSFVALSATVAAHELGHLVGLRHADAFGPVGFGVYLPENAAGFLPVYPGPTAAGETPLHLMASPASTRTDLLAATGTPFFGEREALKLAFADTGTTVAEQARPNRAGLDPQPIELAPLSVPNTLLSGLRAGATFDAAAVDVVGSIEIDPATGRSEDDYYAFEGHAGDVISVEVLSVTLDRVADPIDSIARVWLRNPDGTLSPVPYYAAPAAENDDNFETRDAQLIDLVLPTDGTYLIQVDTFTFLGMPDPPPGGSPSAYTDTDTGAYELFVYRIALAAEGAPGSRSGDLGVGGGGKDTMIASSGSDLYFEEGATEPPAPVIAPPAITPPAPQSALEGTPLWVKLGSFADSSASGPWAVTVNWGDQSPATAFAKDTPGSLGEWQHTFAANGKYAVTVKVTSAAGLSASRMFLVDVANVAPAVTVHNQEALDLVPKAFDLGAFADPALDNPWRVLVNWGDGTAPAAFTRTAVGALGTLTHTFDRVGTFAVTMTVTDKDGGVGTGRFDVVVRDHTPRAQTDTYSTDEDSALHVPAPGVLANDTTPTGNPLTAALVVGPAHGTLTFLSDGSFDYTPAANFNGTDTFTYRAVDGPFTSADTTVTLVVAPVNDPPVARDDSAVTDERTPVEVRVLDNDLDLDGDVLSIDSVTLPAHGTVSANANGSVTYTPAFDFFGDDAFTYTASDGHGGMATAAVRITVRLTNRPPEVHISGLPDTSPEGTALTAGGAVIDPDPGSGLTYAWTVRKNGQPFASGTGANLLFTPDDNGTYAVTLTVTDGFGAAGADTRTVAVTNRPPTGTVTRSAAVGLTGIDVTVGWANVTDPSPVDRAAGFRYSFARTLGALAGTYAAAGPTPSGTIHFDLTPGTYTVYLRVFDKDDGFSDATVAVLIGTPGNDVLTGTDGIDLMFGLGGNDSLTGLGGDDWLDGGDKDDSLEGGSGNDMVFGTEGDDRLSAADGDDTLSGGHGTDVLTAGAGRSLLDGGDGDDQLFAGPGGATLLGGRAADILWSGPGNDSLVGGDGADQVFGTAGADTIDGGAGADTVSGGAGDEFIYGGDGDDSITGGAGNDRLDGGPGDDSLDGGAGNDVLTAGDGINALAGGDGADTLVSGTGADKLTGGAGPDVFRAVSRNGVGEDLVQDFEKGLDRIDLTGLPGVGWSNVTWAKSGADTLVTVTLPAGLGGGTLQIRLKKYTGPLDLTDFLVNP